MSNIKQKYRYFLKFYLFLEDKLGLKRYTLKVFFIFIATFITSLIIATVTFTFIRVSLSFKETEENIKLALKTRVNTSQNELENLKNNVESLIKLGAIEEVKKNKYIKNIYPVNKYDKIKGNKFVFDKNLKSIVFTVDNFIVVVDKSFMDDILIPLSKVGMISKYNPTFDIVPSNSYGYICASMPYENAEFSLIGCVKKSSLVKISLINVLKDALIFVIIFSGVILFVYFKLKDIILFPVEYLNLKINEMRNHHLSKVRLGLHKFVKDEFSEISRSLEDFRRELNKNNKKIWLTIGTINRMFSKSENQGEFYRYILNQIDKIAELIGGILIFEHEYGKKEVFESNGFQKIKDVASKEINFSELEDKEGKIVLDVGSYKCVVIRRFFGTGESFIYIGFKDTYIEIKDLKYIEVILSDFVHILNNYIFANIDFLTKLPNRRKLLQELKKFINLARRYNKNLSIAIIDIDDFKFINDTYGHDVGDMVLIEIAKTLKDSIRETDIAGRYGGEEFLLIFPETAIQDAVLISERIRLNIQHKEIFIGNTKLKVTVSIGVSAYKTNGIEEMELIKAADVSLYHAKKHGKNRVEALGFREIQQIVKKDFSRKNAILRALEEDRFVPFFQPLVDAQKREIVGYEVLARIYEPDKNVYMPAYEFMVDAIKFGLGGNIDNIIQEKALKHVSEYDSTDRLIFFNLSKIFIMENLFMEKLINQIRKYNIQPSRIVFEITEEEALTDYNKVNQFINVCRQIGFKIAIDDFGSGYSNFNYIKNFTADIIKIDGSLVKNIDLNIDDKVIIESIIKIAKHKGVKIIAEMVEREEVATILLGYQVDYLQGYLFSPPVKDLNSLFEEKIYKKIDY